MNTEKSKVTGVFAQKEFKFLRLCLGKNGSGIYIRAHRKSLEKAKKLTLLTKRNRGRNVRAIMKNGFLETHIILHESSDVFWTISAW